jgi:hypothetical protein
VASAFVLRDVQIARDRRRLYGEGLEAVLSDAIKRQRDLATAAHHSLSFANVYEFTKYVNRLWSGLYWQQVPAEWMDPTLPSTMTGGRFTNKVFSEEMKFRDRHALEILSAAMSNKESVIAVVGRSHVEAQASALRCVASNL